MLTDRDLQELLHFKAKHSILSVYLNTDPAEGNATTHKKRLRSMLKGIELIDDLQAVERYFEHKHDWTGRSAAVFSCAAEGFFKAYPLAVALRSRARVSDRPHVKPLADLLDSYGGYGVALVDQQGVRLFHFHLGELQEQEGLTGEAVRHTKRGGGSQAAGRRGGTAGQTDYQEEVVERNIKVAADFSTRFFAEKNVRRILIGGSDANISLFRRQLPKSWQSLVVGSFPVSMQSSHTEVLERAMQIGREAEQRREEQLASSLVTSAAKGRGGVIHLEETLNALREGRVQTLLIRDGFRAPGMRCTQCGFISSLPMERCPFCNGKTEKVPDVAEVAVHQVMEAGGEVEVLHPEQQVKGFEQIGALLRY